jgi:hypothetical protein
MLSSACNMVRHDITSEYERVISMTSDHYTTALAAAPLLLNGDLQIRRADSERVRLLPGRFQCLQ